MATTTAAKTATKTAKKPAKKKSPSEKIVLVPPKKKKKKPRQPIGGVIVLDSVAKKADALMKSINSFKVKNPGTAGLPVLEKALKNINKDVAKIKKAK